MNNKELEMKAREHDVSDAKVETVAGEVTTGYGKIEHGVVAGYKMIEDGVVGGYKAIENGVVEGFGKMVDKCVEVLFAKDGETVEEAKARLSGKNQE